MAFRKGTPLAVQQHSARRRALQSAAVQQRAILARGTDCAADASSLNSVQPG